MNTLVITTLGAPRPKQSFKMWRGRPVGITEANKKLKHWTHRLARAAREATDVAGCWGALDLIEVIRTGGAIRMDATFYIPIKNRKKWGKPHTAVPDEDNLRKTVKDVLQKAGVLSNDSRIFGGETWKFYAQEGGCTLKLTPHGLTPDADDDEDLGVGYVASNST